MKNSLIAFMRIIIPCHYHLCLCVFVFRFLASVQVFGCSKQGYRYRGHHALRHRSVCHPCRVGSESGHYAEAVCCLLPIRVFRGLSFPVFKQLTSGKLQPSVVASASTVDPAVSRPAPDVGVELGSAHSEYLNRFACTIQYRERYVGEFRCHCCSISGIIPFSFRVS